MDITNNYEVIKYTRGNLDKYTNQYIIHDCHIYYTNGLRHRDNDLPAVIYSNGSQEWWFNGQLHRDNDKPAIDQFKYKKWIVNGKLHRNNTQPAVVYLGGVKEWWIDGKYITQRYC